MPIIELRVDTYWARDAALETTDVGSSTTGGGGGVTGAAALGALPFLGGDRQQEHK